MTPAINGHGGIAHVKKPYIQTVNQILIDNTDQGHGFDGSEILKVSNLGYETSGMQCKTRTTTGDVKQYWMFEDCIWPTIINNSEWVGGVRPTINASNTGKLRTRN